MTTLTIDGVREALNLVTAQGGFLLAHPQWDSSIFFFSVTISVTIGAFLVAAGALLNKERDGVPARKLWVWRAGGLSTLCVASAVAWYGYWRPLDAALVPPTMVLMEADAYLRVKAEPQSRSPDHLNLANLVDARHRVHKSLKAAEAQLRQLNLVSGQRCPDQHASLETAQLLLSSRQHP